MLTAEVHVKFEGDWTDEIAEYEAVGEFLASTFRNREYIGLIALETTDLPSTVAIIQSHQSIKSVTKIEEYDTVTENRTGATLFIEGRLSQFTPLQTLLYEGFLPIGPTTLEDGNEVFNLLLSERAELPRAVGLLEEYGPVSVERISNEFSRQVIPSATGWQELLTSVPPRQRAVLNTATELGYYEIPRQATLADIADELDITKTTASNHLRKAEGRIIEFLVTYLNLAEHRT